MHQTRTHWLLPHPACLQFDGAVSVLSSLRINSLSLGISKTGFQASTSGTFGGMSVGAQVGYTSSSKAISLSMTASNVALGGAIAAMVGRMGWKLPKPMLDFANTLEYSTVSISYANQQYAATATPVALKSPTLKALISSMGINDKAFRLTISSAGIFLGVQQNFTFAMPAPYTKPGTLAISLGIDAASAGLVYKSQFDSEVALPGLAKPVGLRVCGGHLGALPARIAAGCML
jgi:hypothetical protein